MRRLFENKINILLTFLLITVLGALGFFAYRMLSYEEPILVPDFSNKSELEVNEWCSSFESNPCTITTDYSDSIDKDYVIYQSISANEEMSNSITFIISLGKKIEINIPQISETTTREDIENWAKENNLVNVNYIQEASENIEMGIVIRIEPSIIQTLDTVINVYISSGSDNKSQSLVVKKNAYIDLSVSEFETKVKALGLKPVYASSKDDYSSTIEKGKIVWHGSGDYVTGEDIRYGLSKGKDENSINVVKGTMVGLTLDEFNEKISKLGTVGLKAKHNEEYDAYSSTIEKDLIVWHGSGNYEDGEDISYGICLGEYKDKIIVTYGTFINSNVEDFESAVSQIGSSGLKPNHNTSKDSYSDVVDLGKIVWHGAGNYEDGETINYGLSLGKEGSKQEDIVIKEGQFVGKTLSEFKAEVDKLGLSTKHREDWDSKDTSKSSDTLCKNGYGTYKVGESVSYGLYTGGSSSNEIIVKQGQYIGKTLTEFKEAVEALGLVANHRSEWDVKDSSKSASTICRNGYGTYEKGEKISYGLYVGDNSSSSSTIVISKGQYVGKTFDEFKKAVEALGLVAEHSNVYSDDYSSTIAKGSLDWHGSGDYVKGEVIHYTLSLGKEEKVTVSSGYEGKSVSEFDTYIKGLGLSTSKSGNDYSETIAEGLVLSYSTGSYSKGASVTYKVSLGSNPNVTVSSGLEGKSVTDFKASIPSSLSVEHDTSLDKYSTYTKDTICSYTSGTYTKGSSVKYGLSLGKAPVTINAVDFYNKQYGVNYHSYAEMESKMKELLSGFTNISYESCTSMNRDPGMIEKIKVNGSEIYEPGEYSSDTSVVVYIVSAKQAS